MHSRRRRIDRPPSQVRESMTFKLCLSASQNGQRMSGLNVAFRGQKRKNHKGWGHERGRARSASQARKRSYENPEFFGAFFGGFRRGRARLLSKSRTIGG